MQLVNNTYKLSKHFSAAETTASMYADRFKINNSLPIILLDNAKMIADSILEPIRNHFGAFSPLSWYRCPRLNKMIKGSQRSQHIEALAVDIRMRDVSLIELARYCYSNIDYDQLILEFYDALDPNKGWVHISREVVDNRGQFLIYDGKRYSDGRKGGILRR